eukprot:404799_1
MFYSVIILIWQLTVSYSAPTCAYINANTGLGTPLNVCHAVYNDGLLRSYEYICQDDGYYEITHANHLCLNGPLSRTIDITNFVLYGDCHDGECVNNLMEFKAFINDNCTENYNETYGSDTLLINECMKTTTVISTPPTRAAAVYCNDNFFQIGYFGDDDCEGGFLTWPQRFYFDQCDTQGFPNVYYKLEKCTDPINVDVLNKYPYTNGTKKDFDRFFTLFVAKNHH